MFADEDTAVLFADFGEAVEVQGAEVTGIVNAASDLVLGEVLVTAPSLEVPATVAAAEGGSVTVRGVAYTIRQVLDLPPDGAIRQLVLAQAD